MKFQGLINSCSISAPTNIYLQSLSGDSINLISKFSRTAHLVDLSETSEGSL